MVRRSATCDPGRLEQLLRDRLPEDLRRDLEAHLFRCPACRDRRGQYLVHLILGANIVGQSDTAKARAFS